MDMYRSKSSLFVKIATVSAILLVGILLFTLIIIDENYGMIGGIILGTLILGLVIYYYAISLYSIILEKDNLILKKNIGQIKIPKSDILEVRELAYSNLTMTYGSKGVFGFIGNTMDDAVSLVKDRNHMLSITTKNKKYLLSSERSDELIAKIKLLSNIM